MKKLCQFLILTLIISSSFGQTKEQTNPWFNSISLDGSTKEIQARLDEDPRIIRIAKKEITDSVNQRVKGHTFYGKFVNPALLNVNPDSSKIGLYFGRWATPPFNTHASTKYSGMLKVVQAEYFFSDTTIIEKLYVSALNDFSKGTKKKDRKKYRLILSEINGKNLFGNGREIYYSNNLKSFSKIRLMKQRSSSNEHSLVIESWTSME